MKPTQLPLVETMKEEDFDFADSAFFSPKELETTKEMKFREAIADPNSPEAIKVIQLSREADGVISTANIKVGEIYYEIQQILSNPRNGSFTAFLEWKGLKYNTVYRAINAYKFTFANGENKLELLESVPVRVLSEAGKSNADPEFKEKVLAGEITTIKEMDAWKEEKKKILAEKEQIMRQRDEYAQAKVKLEQQLAKKPAEVITETVRFDEEAVDRARAEEREKAEREYNIRLKEERKRIEEQLASEIRHHENNIANLENELAILRPLKKREAEIIEKQKQIDEAREEVYRAKMRNNLFDAVTKARRMFNDAIYPVVTVTMTPEIIGDTLKAELQQLMKMTEDFAFAMKQKFNL